MVSTKTLAVYRKELIDTLRDSRSIFAIFVFPFLLYPAMLFFTSWIQSKNDQESKELQVRVGVVGQGELPFVMDSLAAVPGVTPVALNDVPSNIEGGGVNAVLVIPHGIRDMLARGDSVKVNLLYKDSDHASSAAADRLDPVLTAIRQALTVSWAETHGAHTNGPPALAVETKDISSKEEMGRFFAALLIPLLLVLMVAVGAMHTAVDATTGEKERSTLETILATSATRAELVLGKCMAVLTAALTGAVTGITGLWLTFNVVVRAVPGMEGRHTMQLAIDPRAAFLIFLTLIPTAIFLSAVLIVIGCFARSMREGMTYASYIYFASIFLAVGSFGQQAPPLQRFYIPILNTALLQREILTNTVQPAHALAAIGVTIAAALFMLVIAVRLFSNEGVLFRT